MANDDDLPEFFSEAHRVSQQRLTLWATIGNLGGLIALGSVAADGFEKPRLLALIFPSLWSFALGSAAAVAMNVALWDAYASIVSHHRRTGEVRGAGNVSTLVVGGGGVIAMTAFLVGLFYPLIAMSARYLRDGGF